MVKLDTDLPLPEPVEALRIEPRYESLLAALQRCEFKSLFQEIQAEAAASTAKTQGEQGELF